MTTITADNVKAVGLGVGLLALGYVGWKAYTKGPQAIADAANAINPTNHDNIFASGVNAVGGAIVSDPEGAGKNADGSWTLGGWVYDVMHPGWADAATGPVSQAPTQKQAEGVQYDAMGNVIGVYQPANTGGATGSW